MNQTPTSASRTFTVGAQVGLVHGGGRLTVETGHARLTLDRMTRTLTGVGEVIHSTPSISLRRVRVCLPWINTRLILSGDDGTQAVASTWFPARRRLAHALEEAGFVVNHEVAWFKLGPS